VGGFLQLSAHEIQCGPVCIQFEATLEHGTYILILRQILDCLQLGVRQRVERYPDFLIRREKLGRLSGYIEIESMCFEPGHDMGAEHAVGQKRFTTRYRLGRDYRHDGCRGVLECVHRLCWQ